MLQVSLEMLNTKERLVLQMSLAIGNLPLRKNFDTLESESTFKHSKQFLISFKHHKQKGLRKLISS